MKLITISGLDGSGKSTQLDLLEKELQKKFAVERFHMIDFSIANKILGKKKKSSSSTNGQKSKAKTKASFWGIYARKTAVIIDVFRFRFYYRLKVFENKLDYLLVDRYFYDQVVNIKYLDIERKIKKQSFWQTIAEEHIIKPDIKIYLRITPEQILRRPGKVEQGKKYLLEKHKLYEDFAKKWKLTIINGRGSKKNIHQKIKVNLNL